jgi:hypothetical protein
MRLAADNGRGLERVEFRHRLRVDVDNFEAGLAAWRARCACGWKSAVKTTDIDAAARTALAHNSGFSWGVGDRGALLDLLDEPS